MERIPNRWWWAKSWCVGFKIERGVSLGRASLEGMGNYSSRQLSILSRVLKSAKKKTKSRFPARQNALYTEQAIFIVWTILSLLWSRSFHRFQEHHKDEVAYSRTPLDTGTSSVVLVETLNLT